MKNSLEIEDLFDIIEQSYKVISKQIEDLEYKQSMDQYKKEEVV